MGYGDRREFVDAVAVEAICENLNTSGQPDPDLVIRTSGEQRLSGHHASRLAVESVFDALAGRVEL